MSERPESTSASARGRILVVDDKESFLALFEKILSGHAVTTASDATRALAVLQAGDFDLVISDIRMPGMDGLALLAAVKRSCPDVEVVLMTAYGSVSTAVEAMKAGAYDYITKPFEPDEVLLVVERALERKRLRVQARELRLALAGAERFEDMVGKSAPMQRVFELVRRAAASDATALVTGESGTGKELVARAVHRAGPRAGRRFVAVNCGAIPKDLMESELFGHVKGSFTGAQSDRRGLFEEADGGTLFLDEIGELPLPLQVKLTRALQERAIRRVGASEERPVDVRIVAATNVDLRAAVRSGELREDLFYRLNVFPIRLPPLRERREDVPLLAAVFLDRHARGRSAPVEGFTADALGALMRYDWPGNVRELENVIQRALAVSDGARIGLDALPEEVVEADRPTLRGAAVAALSYKEALELARDRASHEYLTALLREFRGNVTQASERAGVERESLHRLLRRYGVRSEDFKTAE